MRIALVSRELHPIGGDGLGVAVAGLANALSEVADVLVLTSSANEEQHRRLRATGELAWPEQVQVEFVPEPAHGDFGSYYSLLHLYSALVLERLRELYGDSGPDIVELPDLLGEGLVTVQARRGYDPFLRDTQVDVRLHGSTEIRGVLNGFVDDEFEPEQPFIAERHVLREADRVLWPGGDVLGAYQRFYGKAALAPATRVRGLITPLPPPARDALPPPAEDGLRLLYVGRLERRKGVQDLVRALGGVKRDGWSLTLAGGDTDTAPLGSSMREQLELASAGDPRIRFVDPVPRTRLAELVAESHVVVCPSRWDCWPSVVLEALAAGRPVLGTPTGGLVEMLASPGAGWLTEDTGEESLARGVDGLLEHPARVDELIASGGPREAYAVLSDPTRFRSEHREAAGARVSRSAPPRSRTSPTGRPEPLVSVVIPHLREDRPLEETIRSVSEQEHRRLEVIVVKVASLGGDDGVPADLATRLQIRVLTQHRSEAGRARNAGIAQSTGAYVLPLDADRLLGPGYIRRCLDVLERDRDVAFVTTWSRYVDERGHELTGLAAGHQPIGNRSPAVLRENIAGDGSALIRKRVFDLGHWYSPELASCQDWQFYRELHSAGLYGRAIPERLLLHRIRPDATVGDVEPRAHARLRGEMTAALREKEMTWASRSG